MKWRVSAVVKFLAVVAVYFGGGYLGLKFARVNPSVSAVWPPTGVAIAALLLWGKRLWPAVFVGAFLTNLFTSVPWATALGIAAGNTLEAVSAAWLTEHYAGGLRVFERAQTILTFALVAGVVSTTISAAVGATSLCLGGLAGWGDFGRVWLTWWTGDLVGALKFTPLIIVWWPPVPRLSSRQIVEAACLLASVVVSAYLVFDLNTLPLGYMMVPPLLWATLRFGRHGAVLSSVILSVFAIWGTLHGLGPYATDEPNESLLFVQAYVGTIVVSALILAAVVSENRRTLEEFGIQQQQVQDRVEELETFMEAAPAVIWIAHDPECNVITGNRLGEEILRAPSGKNLSKTGATGLLQIEFRKDGRVLADSELPLQLAARERRALWNYETEMRFPDGASQWLYGNVVPMMKPDGEVRCILAVFVDITELKKTEQALALSRKDLEQLNRELDDRVRRRTAQLQTTIEELEAFSYSVSHDLRAPLRSIQSFSEIVLNDYGSKLEPEAIELLRKVVRAAGRLDCLTRDVLAFSRVSRQEIKIENVDVDRLVRQIIQERPEWQPPQAEIEIRGRLPDVRGHEPSLTQCITNLLDNAVKFVAAGTQPRVVIAAEIVDNVVRIWFEDNGIGIDSGVQHRMFSMFQRFHRESAYPGTGIGLAIVRKAVERMNGKVGVESESEKGSRFWLELERA